MHQQTFAQLVEESMMQGERFVDLMWMAKRLHDWTPANAGGGKEQARTANSDTELSAARRQHAGDELPLEGPVKRLWFLCFLSKPKPPAYKEAVHEFRRSFYGVFEDQNLQHVFWASIRAELWKASDHPLPETPEPPSTYFDLEAAQSEATTRKISFPTPASWY